MYLLLLIHLMWNLIRLWPMTSLHQWKKGEEIGEKGFGVLHLMVSKWQQTSCDPYANTQLRPLARQIYPSSSHPLGI